MRSFKAATPCVLALALAAGCASTKGTAQPTQLGMEKIARPDRIVVYDFAATRSDLPSWASASYLSPVDDTMQTAEQIATGRKLGAEIAKELVAEINTMGMTAVSATEAAPPRVGDIAIVGYFGSVDKGSLTERLVIGFGKGGAELKTAVEGYLMTEEGMQKLGEGEVDAGPGKAPGLLVPAVVTAATANPIGLAVSGAVKAEGELTGRTTIEGDANRTAKEIGAHLKTRFQEEGWI